MPLTHGALKETDHTSKQQNTADRRNSCFPATTIFTLEKQQAVDYSSGSQWASSLLRGQTSVVGWRDGALQAFRKLIFLGLLFTLYAYADLFGAFFERLAGLPEVR